MCILGFEGQLLANYLLTALTPAALIIGSAVGSYRMGLDRRKDLGLRLPGAMAALLALVAFLLLSVATEFVYQRFGLGSETGGWQDKYSPTALSIRIALIALIFPVAEEVFFRGFLFGLLRRKIGEAAAIVGSAIVFALLHLQYDWRGMLLILVDGLFFGIVRSRTKSTLLTIGLHILGNCYAVWQRL